MKRLGLILAGGASSRMGTNKALLEFAGERLIDRAIGKLARQVEQVAVSGAGISGLDVPLIADEVAGQGPLSGILAGLSFARAQGFESLLSIAVDTPFFPDDLAARLPPSHFVARHYTCAHWPVSAEAEVRLRLANGERKLAPLLASLGFAGVEMGDEAFFNVNTREELAEAIRRLA